MNNLDRLYEIVGPDKSFLRLMDLLFGEEENSRNKKISRIILFDLDNVVFKTNQILTEKWLSKTFWRRYIHDDIQEVDMDKFFFSPEEIGIPAKKVDLFRLHIMLSIVRLTREMRKMKRNGEEEIANNDIVNVIREARKSGMEVVFLTNRPCRMWRETKKQLELALGKDARNIILHMRRGFKKIDVMSELAYFSVGLVDDKISNLAGLNLIGKLAILFTNNGDVKTEYSTFVNVAKTGEEIGKMLRDCKIKYIDTSDGPTLVATL